MSKLRKMPFDSNGTEGMLDVILGCTLIFLLLTALVKVEAGNNREITLPEMNLSTSNKSAGDVAKISKRTILSLKWVQNKTEVWIDETKVTLTQLPTRLKALGPVAVVALRRDRNLPCRIEDSIITECRKAGIQRIAIMLKEE